MVVRQKIALGLLLTTAAACGPGLHMRRPALVDVGRYGERLAIEVIGEDQEWTREVDRAVNEALALGPRHRLRRVAPQSPYDLHVSIGVSPLTTSLTGGDQASVDLSIHGPRGAVVLQQRLDITLAPGRTQRQSADEVGRQVTRIFAPWFRYLARDARLLGCSTSRCSQTQGHFLAGRFDATELLLTEALGPYADPTAAVPAADQEAVASVLCRRAMVREYQEHLERAAADHRRAVDLSTPSAACQRMRQRLDNYIGTRQALTP